MNISKSLNLPDGTSLPWPYMLLINSILELVCIWSEYFSFAIRPMYVLDTMIPRAIKILQSKKMFSDCFDIDEKILIVSARFYFFPNILHHTY